MNRTALGLAVGAGYFLGRTKKLKMALAVGSLVAGKKLNLGPRGLAELAQRQLRDNPQFKEIGDQLRDDLRGVGKAATGAMAERQMSALADRLHGRTATVRDQLAGVVPEQDEEDGEPQEDSAEREDEDESSRAEADREEAGKAPRKKASGKAPARKTAAKTAGGAARKAGSARKAAAKKTAAAGAAARGGRTRQSKGGDDR
ncbi:hypothetical protein GCM10010503_57360 [Streptomyces lucensis JCM 4490]|uniref:DNA primase n=1 Tax=Streptomyces lucensis JCM 4490 TaxID=1306176 RepID=A0A918MV55_9ACTN|nr:DNA primase [Streptomyces lucensis]GGW72389.1 hypothetical protein GCM10010503_57360 [Streptomyces lucensis JCM 4490]